MKLPPILDRKDSVDKNKCLQCIYIYIYIKGKTKMSKNHLRYCKKKPNIEKEKANKQHLKKKEEMNTTNLHQL